MTDLGLAWRQGHEATESLVANFGGVEEMVGAGLQGNPVSGTIPKVSLKVPSQAF